VNAKYIAKNALKLTLNERHYNLDAADPVRVVDRNGNMSVTIEMPGGNKEVVNASWFLNNFTGVPI
jgi:HSP20 family molecular chaperone IbpA